MREIVLDTETTGLDPFSGHRLVEIAGVELVNSNRTGDHFHAYINPERDMPEDAFAVHGLSSAFLAGHRVFASIADEFLAFVRGAKLVIHNAEFDMRFINAELRTLGRDPILMESVVDTLALARRRHPGAPASLDALCQRFRIDSSRRVKHGALLDAELLAEVYAELLGGRQITFSLSALAPLPELRLAPVIRHRERPLPDVVDAVDLAAHAAFVASLGPAALWTRYPVVDSVASIVDRQLAQVAEA